MNNILIASAIYQKRAWEHPGFVKVVSREDNS